MEFRVYRVWGLGLGQEFALGFGGVCCLAKEQYGIRIPVSATSTPSALIFVPSVLQQP